MTVRPEVTTPLIDSSLLAASRRLVSIDTTDVGTVDVLPMRVDLALGDQFAYIGFDDAMILARMRAEGLSESQIAQLPIHVSAATSRAPNDSRHLGSFDSEAKQITLYPNVHLDSAQELYQEVCRAAGLEMVPAFVASASDEAVAHEVAGTLYHEIRHARHHLVDTAMAAESKRHYRRARLPITIGMIATQLTLLSGNFAANTAYPQGGAGFAALTFIATLSGMYAAGKVTGRMLDKKWPQVYLSDPGEIDARVAGAEAPDTVVQLVTKPNVLRTGYETRDTPRRTLIARFLGNVATGLR